MLLVYEPYCTIRKRGQSQDGAKVLVSQQCVKYTWFLLFTANQSDHPGLAHLHAWKDTMEWTKNIPKYESLSYFEKAGMKRAMDQAYGVCVYASWNTVNNVILQYI